MCVRCEWAHSCQRPSPSPSPGFRFKTNAALGNSVKVATSSALWHRGIVGFLGFNPASSLHTHSKGKNLSVVEQKHTLPGRASSCSLPGPEPCLAEPAK